MMTHVKAETHTDTGRDTPFPPDFHREPPAAIRTELREAELSARGAHLKAFEVTLYNAEVRACLKDNSDHNLYNERWAESQHIVIHAWDEMGLAHKLKHLYPSTAGFTIEDIVELSACAGAKR